MIRFGTDGVRGVAFEQLTTDYVARLGRVAARRLGSTRVLIGQDTRESGAQLAAALAGGLRAGGCDVEFLGVMPTPAIAYLAQVDGCAAAAITASHNPYQDNGVKLFSVGGNKLTDEMQDLIESDLAEASSDPVDQAMSLSRIDRSDAYVAHACSVIAPRDLRGVTVVLDCANGAMSDVAPRTFAALGATVIAINDEPNGRNINEGCGAAHPEALSEAVRLHSADLGLAFDGDGDRVIAVDHVGNVVDGDQTIALFALDMDSRGELDQQSVVVTVMTNAGFHSAMRDAGITVHTTPVGDRHVLVAMESTSSVLGGEQSGHIILRRHATTGDGLLAGVLLVDLVRRNNTPLERLAVEAMIPLPQHLINVKVNAVVHDVAHVCADEVAHAEQSLGGVGRVLLRASGTEPLIRVMVEAATDDDARQIASDLADAVAKRLGGSR
jgi:phosphoglucosamine mutase